MEDNVRAYLAQILAYGINLDGVPDDELPVFVKSFVKWCVSEIHDLDFSGDEDGVLCLRDDDIFASITFGNNHLKFHLFDHSNLEAKESSILMAKITLAAIGFCQAYFDETPSIKTPSVKHPEITAGSSEEVISVKDDGFGIV